MAARHFSDVAKDPAAEPTMKEMNAALFACADGQWERASVTLRQLLDQDAENYAVSIFPCCMRRYNVDLVSGGEQLGSGSLGPRPGTRGWYAPIGESILV